MADCTNPSRSPGGRTSMGLCGGGKDGSKISDGRGVLRHDPGISFVWTPQEQSILEDFLTRYGKDINVVQYAKIAKALPDKTIRDVAFRCRWMSEKEIVKQRKNDLNSSEKNKKVKERVTDSMVTSSQVTNDYNSMMDCGDGISYKMIGGASRKLLEQNAKALDQIVANISDSKMHENFRLFHQARLNIQSILNDGSNMTETMKQMPPLPVQLNEELAMAILSLPSSCYMPEIMKQMHFQSK